MSDLDDNRAGRISTAQRQNIDTVSARGHRAVLVMLGSVLVLTGGSALYLYMQDGQPLIFLSPAIALVFVLGVYFLVYRRARLPNATQLADAKVVMQRAKVTAVLGSNRGVYNVWLDGTRYSGMYPIPEAAKRDQLVDAYLVAEHKLVIALVPAAT